MDPPRDARPMRAATSAGQPAGGFPVSRYPKPEPAPGSMPVIAYRTCPCGRRFPIFRLPGRPPTHCFPHRGTSARRRQAHLQRVWNR